MGTRGGAGCLFRDRRRVPSVGGPPLEQFNMIVLQ